MQGSAGRQLQGDVMCIRLFMCALHVRCKPRMLAVPKSAPFPPLPLLCSWVECGMAWAPSSRGASHSWLPRCVCRQQKHNGGEGRLGMAYAACTSPHVLSWVMCWVV